MPRTKKTEESVIDIANDAKIITQVETENEELKSKLAELEAKISLLMQMQSSSDYVDKSKTKRRITFYNMLPNKVVFKGTKVHILEKQFDYAIFTEAEAQAIVSNTYNAIKNGFLYIADAKFVEENDLDTIYSDLLSNESLKNLLEHDSNYVIEIYKSANAGQKDIIVNMLIDKKLNGQHVDANILVELGKLCNRDLLHIEPFAE